MPAPRGSGFVGLQQYLNANQQAAQQMGNALASGIEQEGAATKQATDDAVRTFNDAAGVNAQYNQLGGLPGSMQAMPSAMANVDTANRVLGGKNELGDVVDVDALNARASSLQDRARLAGSDAGASVLMSQGGKGASTQGGRALDSFLARRGAGERLDNASTAYGRLASYVGAQQEQAKANASAAKDRARSALGTAGAYLGGLPSAAPPPTATPAPQQAPRPQAPPQYTQVTGNVRVPVNTPAPTTPVQIGNTTIQPNKPKPGEGNWVGNVWVPAGG